MRFWNWQEGFMEKPTITREEILSGVKTMETVYWAMAFGCVFFMCVGFPLIAAGFWNTKLLILGVFIELDASIMLALIKIQAQIRLSTLRVLWHMENRTAQEHAQMQAADL